MGRAISDILFQRAVLASLLLFAVVASAYFRLAGPRTFSVAVRFLPIAGAAFVAVPIVFNLPLVAKTLCGVLGGGSLFVCLLALILVRRFRSSIKAKQQT